MNRLLTVTALSATGLIAGLVVPKVVGRPPAPSECYDDAVAPGDGWNAAAGNLGLKHDIRWSTGQLGEIGRKLDDAAGGSPGEDQLFYINVTTDGFDTVTSVGLGACPKE